MVTITSVFVLSVVSYPTALARLCSQVAGLGKQIVRSELRARDVALQAEAAEAAACKKDMERLAQVGAGREGRRGTNGGCIAVEEGNAEYPRGGGEG